MSPTYPAMDSNNDSSRALIVRDGASDGDCDSSDSDCPVLIPGDKGIDITLSDIPKLRHNCTLAQYNNWLVDVKSAFEGYPARFPTSRRKIILASFTLDEQLKTIYTYSIEASPILSRHWRKFERWLRNDVLRVDSNEGKLINEYAATRQTIDEDPIKFYWRLFIIAMQSGRPLTTEIYLFRLHQSLRNLMIQYSSNDLNYPTIQDAVAHAERIWSTLDPGEIREEENICQRRHKSKQFRRGDRSWPPPEQEVRQKKHPRAGEQPLRADKLRDRASNKRQKN
jgi:hypothetical protein